MHPHLPLIEQSTTGTNMLDYMGTNALVGRMTEGYIRSGRSKDRFIFWGIPW